MLQFQKPDSSRVVNSARGETVRVVGMSHDFEQIAMPLMLELEPLAHSLSWHCMWIKFIRNGRGIPVDAYTSNEIRSKNIECAITVICAQVLTEKFLIEILIDRCSEIYEGTKIEIFCSIVSKEVLQSISSKNINIKYNSIVDRDGGEVLNNSLTQIPMEQFKKSFVPSIIARQVFSRSGEYSPKGQ